MVDVIDTQDGFLQLKEEWERIAANPNLRIFQTYFWCKTAWDKYVSKDSGAKLWILRWNQDGKDDVVIFPFYIDGRGCLRFIMDTHSDACDAVYDERILNRHWVFKEVAEAILANAAIKAVFLQKLTGTSLALNYLAILLPGSIVNRDNAYSWLESNKTDSFIAGQTHLKRKDRDRLKAISKKVACLQFDVLSKENGNEFPCGAVKELRTQMLVCRRKDISFLSDDMIDFISEIYDGEMCEIACLSDSDALQAMAFRLLKGDRINYWIVLYRDPKFTTELYLKYMEKKSSESRHIFDFGVGAYQYKLGTYRSALGITHSLRYSKSLLGHFSMLARANVRLLKDMLKPRIARHCNGSR